MKPVLVFTAGVLLFAIGCKTRTASPQVQPPKQETPKALQDKSYEPGLLSKSRAGGDLVDEIYDELLSKDAGLKDIEVLISEYRERRPDSLEMFNTFETKNQSYYFAANAHLASITDSVLKEKMKMLIETGNNNYKNSIAGMDALIKQLDKKSASINDLHTALKIVRTLPVMEQYQKGNMPSSKPVESVLKAAEKIIVKEDSVLKN